MSTYREYEVSAEALVQGKDLGFGPAAARRIAHMARRGAPVTHPLGNRRVDDFVLRVRGNVVLSIARRQRDERC